MESCIITQEIYIWATGSTMYEKDTEVTSIWLENIMKETGDAISGTDWEKFSVYEDRGSKDSLNMAKRMELPLFLITLVMSVKRSGDEESWFQEKKVAPMERDLDDMKFYAKLWKECK